jgi:uncharacterized protein involved in exopolysaccharide biosynthesis
MEDVVEQMRTRDITTRTDKGDAFRIAYTGPNKRVVKEVTEKLTSLFISENVRNRGNLADGTSQFLEASLEEARRNLKDQEEKVAQFRQRYAGELPNQMDSNIQAQRSTEMQIQALVESLRNDRERQINYERAIADAEQELADVPVTQPAMASTPGMPPSTLAQKVAAARSHLADLRTRYRDTNVDVVRAKHELEELEALLKKEEQPEHATATDGRPMPVVSNQEFQRRKRLEDLRGQLERLERKIAEGEKEEKRLRAIVGAYQRRVEAVPSRETELADLTRGYDSLRGIFEARFKNLEDARTSANLERRQIGEQFQLLEPPRIPERPYSPNRRAINLFGLMAGLGCGLALAALFEYRDKSFKTDQEISHLLALPVLAVVPLMQSAVEKRTAWKMQLILGIGCGTVVAGCLAVVAYATFVLR